MAVKPTESETSAIEAALLCQSRHGSVSAASQSGIGWLAPLLAIMGLCMALAGASGWGEKPGSDAGLQDLRPSGESHTHGVTQQDAAPPDSHERDNLLVGLR